MADRSVVVRLRAEIGQYQAGMAKAKQATTEFGREVTGQGKSARTNIEAVGKASLVAGGVMALGLGKAVSSAMGFEKELSGVRAVSGATAAEMEQLSDAALAAGASQKLAGVTASDAARAEAELVKAGVSVSNVLGGALMGSLTLAAAGQLDFADAATIAAQAMNIFGLGGGQVEHIADVLAAAANKSAADVAQLGDALRQGGLVASQTGLSLDETVGALAAFADNALIGSDAGTSLKTMLQRLTPQSKEARELMDELGFSAYDAQGNFIGLEGLAGELQTSLADMTVEQRNSAMATLFGSDAVRGANILYQEGAEGIRGYVEAVNDQGAAARMAAIQNDNLSGDIEALGGALESALIQNGSKANGILRDLTQTATNAVTGFSSLPEPVQTVAFGLGAVTTAGLGALGVIGTFGPKIREAKTSLEGMGKVGNTLANNMGKIGGALSVVGAGVAVFSAWETAMAGARTEAEEWSSTWRPAALSAAADGMAAFSAKLKTVREEQARMASEARNSDAPWDADKREQLRTGARELQDIGNEMVRITDLAANLSREYGITRDAALAFIVDQQAAGLQVLGEDYDAVAESVNKTYGSLMTGTVGTQAMASGMETLGSEVATVEEQVQAFSDTLDALINQFFGVEAAQDAFASGLNELPEVLKQAREGGLSLNDVLSSQTDEAIAVRSQMRSMVDDAAALIAEWQEQGVTGDDLAMKIAVLSESFRTHAEAAGLPAPVVDHYLALLGEIPTGPLGPAIQAPGAAETSTKLDRINHQLDGLDGRRITVTIAGQVLGGDKQFMPQSVASDFVGPVQRGTRRGAAGGLVPHGLQPVYRAGGGPIGTDTVNAWLTPGEFVMRKSAVDRFGLGVMQSINAGRMAGGGASYTFAPNIAVHAAPGVDGRLVGRQIVDALTAWSRDNGPLPVAVAS